VELSCGKAPSTRDSAARNVRNCIFCLYAW
jgi:hypothetical protein